MSLHFCGFPLDGPICGARDRFLEVTAQFFANRPKNCPKRKEIVFQPPIIKGYDVTLMEEKKQPYHFLLALQW